MQHKHSPQTHRMPIEFSAHSRGHNQLVLGQRWSWRIARPRVRALSWREGRCRNRKWSRCQSPGRTVRRRRRTATWSSRWWWCWAGRGTSTWPGSRQTSPGESGRSEKWLRWRRTRLICTTPRSHSARTWLLSTSWWTRTLALISGLWREWNVTGVDLRLGCWMLIGGRRQQLIRLKWGRFNEKLNYSSWNGWIYVIIQNLEF